MFKVIRLIAAAVLALGCISTASAQTSANAPAQAGRPNPVFFGGGLSSNSISGWDSAVGMQLFGGYAFGPVANNVLADVEVGYMDSGNMKWRGCGGNPWCSAKFKGIWANGVARLQLTSNVELLGRAGLDLGDDDGFMIGVGAGVVLTRQISLRAEYVARDRINSVQFNLVYRP